MKRCPVDQGGCGELVDVLFNSGVCQKCDAMIERGTAAAGGRPERRGGGRKPDAPPPEAHPEPCDKYVKGPERGICATCQATRAAHLAKPKTERKTRQPAGSNGTSDMDWMTARREGYAQELAEAEENVVRLRIKVEVANEILSELQRAH